MPVSCCRKRISRAMVMGRYMWGSRASAHDMRLLWRHKAAAEGAGPAPPAGATLLWISWGWAETPFFPPGNNPGEGTGLGDPCLNPRLLDQWVDQGRLLRVSISGSSGIQGTEHVL